MRRGLGDRQAKLLLEDLAHRFAGVSGRVAAGG